MIWNWLYPEFRLLTIVFRKKRKLGKSLLCHKKLAIELSRCLLASEITFNSTSVEQCCLCFLSWVCILYTLFLFRSLFGLLFACLYVCPPQIVAFFTSSMCYRFFFLYRFYCIYTVQLLNRLSTTSAASCQQEDACRRVHKETTTNIHTHIIRSTWQFQLSCTSRQHQSTCLRGMSMFFSSFKFC